MSSLSACDECFKRKRKCHFDNDSNQCIRCRTSSLQCTKTRRQGRIGRPPNIGLASEQGAFSIWESNPELEPARAMQQSFFRSGNTPNDGSVNSQDTTTWVPNHDVEREHVVRPSSRPRTTDNNHVGDLVQTGNSGISEIEDETLYTALDIWMFGSTFARDFYRAIHYCHQNSPWLLHEMFIAMDTFIDWARFNRITSERVDIERGARSLQKLRTAEVSGSQDALAILMLGQSLAAFDAFVTSAGSMSILRYSLSLVEPWYPTFAQDPFSDPVTISPIFWDIACCLVYREIPIIRPILRGPPVVDRLAGICTSLLPILYDLCVTGYDMRQDPTQVWRLDSIEERIHHWNPDYGSLQSSRFSQIEIASMRTQAIMYKTASLLLIHRLRYPLTHQDETAVSLANEILDERTAFFANQGNEVTLQNAGLPIFLALLEVPLPADDLWKSSTRLRVRPACVETMITFCKYSWEQKLSGFSGSLFELVDTGPRFVPMP
ncbi:hypothetical protein PHISCL_02419 [Aspergillus sclerotialis]|uniref:Zn(2)-C6 fungal-type domain-containing protein n=1 Tax=Aspergillus sclerotialis TaxID=2070753 RepID=A0A3A2ZQ23_9EURO|nr:hypothetical protein PHISCL_02419 [Aspergillus sclerotialis]